MHRLGQWAVTTKAKNPYRVGSGGALAPSGSAGAAAARHRDLIVAGGSAQLPTIYRERSFAAGGGLILLGLI